MKIPKLWPLYHREVCGRWNLVMQMNNNNVPLVKYQLIAWAVTFGAKWVFICRFWKAYKLGLTLVILTQHPASAITNIRKLKWLEINQCVTSMLPIYPILTNLGHICLNVLNTLRLNLSMTHQSHKTIISTSRLFFGGGARGRMVSGYNKWLA